MMAYLFEVTLEQYLINWNQLIDFTCSKSQ